MGGFWGHERTSPRGGRSKVKSRFLIRARQRVASRLSLVRSGNEDAPQPCSSRRISVLVIDGFATGRIDKMHAAARETSHRLIALLLRLAPFAGNPALYAQARVRAAIKECGHGLITERGRDRNRAGA
jgi:hypothetical protein